LFLLPVFAGNNPQKLFDELFCNNWLSDISRIEGRRQGEHGEWSRRRPNLNLG
jgi:hypothetical protein